MNIQLEYNRNFGKWFLNDVLKAIQTYSLVKDGDRLGVALSGGKDSTTLLYILSYLNGHSPIRMELSAVHVKIADYSTETLQHYCDALNVAYYEESIDVDGAFDTADNCYICSRLKRGALAARLRSLDIQRLAYGHHADDVAETFFMNLVLNKRLGSFSPKVDRGGKSVQMIRPMIYLEEKTVQNIHRSLGLPRLDWQCPLSGRNQRQVFKAALAQMNDLFHTSGFARKVIESLENIDNTNLWKDLI